MLDWRVQTVDWRFSGQDSSGCSTEDRSLHKQQQTNMGWKKDFMHVKNVATRAARYWKKLTLRFLLSLRYIYCDMKNTRIFIR